MNCPQCDTEMVRGYTWLDHVLASGLFWREEPPTFSPLLPGPKGHTILHAHLLNRRQAVREALRCPACQCMTILAGNAES